jgi:hypothetical protein
MGQFHERVSPNMNVNVSVPTICSFSSTARLRTTNCRD